MTATSRKVLPKKFIIIDFNCSREYTHHADYVRSYADYLRSLDLNYEVWINKSADSGVLELLKDHPTSRNLNSLDYSFNRKENFLIYFLNKILNTFLSKVRKSKLPEKIVGSLLDWVAFLLVFSQIKEIRNLIKQESQVSLIFPSTDGLSLRYLGALARGKVGLFGASMRIIGAEKRGVFGFNDLKASISSINRDSLDLRIGWEVHCMMDKMIEIGLESELLHWAPIPTVATTFPKPDSSGKKVLGFLGSARSNKGFSKIPKIVRMLESAEVDFLVQQANFGWDGYSADLEYLVSLNKKISFLPGAASNNELNRAFLKCSMLILPYDLEAYRFAGSGLMYRAANLGIPIFCTDGVGFDWDVKNFGIGSTFTTLEELHLLIQDFKIENYQNSLQNYNKLRNRACDEFIR